MTARADAARGRLAGRLGFAAAIVSAIAFAAVMRDAEHRSQGAVHGPVAPDWSARAEDASRITVTAKGETFHVAKDAQGWRLPERGGRLVDQAVLSMLDRGLGDLAFLERKTSDPDKLDRLGLGDPETGGEGVRIDVETADGQSIASLIVGDPRPGGGLYVRYPDDPRSFAASGALPAVAAPADWLDLAILPVTRSDIAEAEIAPAKGLAYTLVRARPTDRDFALAEPEEGWSLLTAGAGSGVATSLGQMRFLDVREANGDAAPIAAHTVHTFDGLVVTLEVLSAEPIRDGEGSLAWARVIASAEEPGAQADAEALNAAAYGWEFRLPVFAYERLARPLEELASPDAD